MTLRAALCGLARLLSIVALGWSLSGVAAAQSAPAELKVWFLDVGQGDAALIQSPTGKVVLIDAGPRGATDVITKLLTEHGITHIDLALITHAHADHIGGFEGVLKAVSIGLALDPGVAHGTTTYRNLLTALKKAKVPVKRGERGRRIGLGSGAVLTLLGPEVPLLRGTRSDLNSNSLVAQLTFQDVSVLFMGDAEGETEARLMSHDDLKPVTVLKVAHHGSEHSTSSQWLKAVAPKVGVISCGRDNRYDHPGPALMARLKRAKVRVHRTDEQGTALFRSDGSSWSLKSASLRHVDEAAPVRAEVGAVQPVDQPRVDINRASISELDTLPGIGAKKAEAIVKYRSEHGAFIDVEALLRVPGIGKKTLRKLRHRVHVPTPEAR